MVGGAPVSKEFADKMRTDEDAGEAPRSLLG